MTMIIDESCFKGLKLTNLIAKEKEQKFTLIAEKYRTVLQEVIENKHSSFVSWIDKIDKSERDDFIELIFSLIQNSFIDDFTNECSEKLLNYINDIENRLNIFLLYHSVFNIDMVFEKLAPHIEHYPLETKQVLKTLLSKHEEKTVKFLADLAIVSYPFADDLFNEMKIYYIEKQDTKHKNTDVFDHAWEEVKAIRKDRILLFPEIVDK